jgi:hypothetical protein
MAIAEWPARATRLIPQGAGRRDHLSWVCATLVQQFADRLDAVLIERIAAEEVAAFNDAPVRDFIPILAMRRGRLRLWKLGDLREVEEESRPVARVQERDEVRQKGSV